MIHVASTFHLLGVYSSFVYSLAKPCAGSSHISQVPEKDGTLHEEVASEAAVKSTQADISEGKICYVSALSR